ncbi:MAG: class 1 fructose-bisphosphatase [Bacteroidota bacterium]|nr:class 1 fructose-bisphosphatase [Bacteroidota bacterium]MDP4233052.1 class 1 fructose-bisphosphatase [Bacteroidota bacterium]MDP4241803.1 class 1 fructose-bisphosphatase [Bacteroidota bacterium]MDP4288776.1 class 1 fructose-bisphosphatase [Bacteroidota bacterium]
MERHIIEQQASADAERSDGATGDFSALLRDLTLAFKIINREVMQAGLVDVLGATGDVNVQGEIVQKLDAFANTVIYRAMDHGGHLCGMASEEDPDILPIPKDYKCGRYVLLFDPLDGSSNIDVNVSIGTIFSILRRVTPEETHGTLDDFLQPGYKQVAAGYTIYGPSTMLVYTAGRGVFGFTYDPSVGEFLLSHDDIRIPQHGSIYSVNEGNYHKWDSRVQRFIDWAKMDVPDERKKAYSLRYIGSMVADVHRTLLYGGVFLYPADVKSHKGKLRLLYEANPMSFVVEQAGGKASDGSQRVLEIQPEHLHQRTPLIVGSPKNVEEVERFLNGDYS